MVFKAYKAFILFLLAMPSGYIMTMAIAQEGTEDSPKDAAYNKAVEDTTKQQESNSANQSSTNTSQENARALARAIEQTQSAAEALAKEGVHIEFVGNQSSTQAMPAQSILKSGSFSDRYGPMGNKDFITLNSSHERQSIYQAVQSTLAACEKEYTDYQESRYRDLDDDIWQDRGKISKKEIPELIVIQQNLALLNVQACKDLSKLENDLKQSQQALLSARMRYGVNGNAHYDNPHDPIALQLMQIQTNVYWNKLALAQAEDGYIRAQNLLSYVSQRIAQDNDKYLNEQRHNLEKQNLPELYNALADLERRINLLPNELQQHATDKNKHNTDLRASKEKLDSWGWFFNPFGENRSSLEHRIKEEERIAHQDDLDIAYKTNIQKLLPLLQIRAKELISEKEALIRTIIGAPETTSPAITRDQRTIHPSIEPTSAGLHTTTYTISPEINVLMLELDSEMSRYINQPFTGTIIQHYVHKQLIESLDSIKTIVQNTRESEKLLRTALAANRLGHELNAQHKIVAALSAKHACDTFIDYAKSVVDIGLAVGEGIVEGSVSTFEILGSVGKYTVDAVTFPEETATLLKEKCNNATLAVGKLFTELRKDFELMYAGDETSVQEWTDRREARGKKIDAFFDALIEKYNDTPFRDKIKAVSKFATECELFGMLGGALFEEAATAVDMVKLERGIANNTLKNIITLPGETLAAEIIELAVQTIDKDASLVAGAIEFTKDDLLFLSKIRNYQHSNPQVMADFLTETTTNNSYNFTRTTIARMNDEKRFVPVQILDYVIKNTKGLPDPQKTNALMHYSRMWKDGKMYNLEVLFDPEANTIFHFLYTRDPLGPLPKV